ncbi:MAG: AMP-binding protein [Planctomycetota bacterium]|nr:AMP-binding protein [Planctomycetota bacterium]
MSGSPTWFNFARDVVGFWATRQPDALALWWVEEHGREERRLTFAQVDEQARRACSFFHAAGIRRGDRVLVMLPRVVAWWTGMLGLIRLGAVPIPATPQLTARDIAYRLKAGAVAAVWTDEAGAQRVEDFGGVRISTGSVGGTPPGWLSFDAGLAAADPGFDPGPTRADDPGIYYFTSGTVGEPKIVAHTQASYGLGHRLTGELWLDGGTNDVIWCLSDTGWAKAAWSNLFGPWHTGSCVFVLDSRGAFQPHRVLTTLENFPITVWCAPPTALRFIVKQDLSRLKVPHLRHCVSAGEPLNPEVISAWKSATGLTIYEGYGQTETVVLIGQFRRLGAVVRPGSMGRPTPGFDVAVVGPDLRPVPDGQEGEVAVRLSAAPGAARPLGLFREYWNNPAENAARFRGEWYFTGDMAHRDEAGDFWFVGRADDVIKSSGYRIGPFEVESALLEHPGVLEAAVVGRPDPMRGQLVKAYVVLRPGHAASEKLVLELQHHCREVTAPYKYPREIEFVAELPKTVSGKIRRVELRGRAAAGGASHAE